ncbi:hypothetical protein TNCV_4865381 [Trichonephila clavipes]|nr:hypothetical protein TNCV_4865381 [Trichonephila clavipes]
MILFLEYLFQDVINRLSLKTFETAIKCVFSGNVTTSRHPETIDRRKGLSPNDIPNLLLEISENESEGGKLFCSNLDSDKDITLSEINCEESEESTEIIDNIPVSKFW